MHFTLFRFIFVLIFLLSLSLFRFDYTVHGSCAWQSAFDVFCVQTICMCACVRVCV